MSQMLRCLARHRRSAVLSHRGCSGCTSGSLGKQAALVSCCGLHMVSERCPYPCSNHYPIDSANAAVLAVAAGAGQQGRPHAHHQRHPGGARDERGPEAAPAPLRAPLRQIPPLLPGVPLSLLRKLQSACTGRCSELFRCCCCWCCKFGHLKLTLCCFLCSFRRMRT